MHEDQQQKIRILGYAVTGLSVLLVAVPLVAHLLGTVEGTILFGALALGAIAIVAAMLRVIS